jgi:peptidoglycan hydrolase-like protein with peptidoglycan-binding domain
MYIPRKSVVACFLFLATLAAGVDVKADDLSSIQECLTFGGFYWGLADGSPGPLTDKAIRDFQRSIGRPETETGSLTPYDTSRLYEACEKKKRRLGWAPYRLASSNITIELPLGILALKEESPQRETLRFMGLGGDIGIWIYHTLQPHPEYMTSTYSAMERMSDARVNYKVWKGNWFVISGSEPDGNFFYDYCRLDGDRLFCYEMTWTERADPLVRGVQIMILNSFKKHNFLARATTSSTLILSDIPYEEPDAKATTPSMRAPVTQGPNTFYPVTGKLSPTEIFKKAKNAVWMLLSFQCQVWQARLR